MGIQCNRGKTVVDSEFKVQVIETDAQWKSGLWSSLDFNSDGLSLFLNPAFDSWVIPERTGFRGDDIVVDECGQTYWTERETSDPNTWSLFRHNPITDQVELVLAFGPCSEINPREIWLDQNYLWIFDRDIDESGTPLPKGRMLAFSRDNFQIVLEFVIEDDLIDIDFHPNGYFYAVTKQNCRTQVCRYSTSVPPGKGNCFTVNTSIDPVAIAVSKDGLVYLLDAVRGRFIRFEPETRRETVLCSAPENILKDIEPTAMQIDGRGVLFLASSNPASLHMFDKDGSYLGEADLPSKITRIDGIGFDRGGGVLLATDIGLARLLLTKSPVGHSGSFYSRTLDNGQPKSLWHRIALRGRIPAKSSVEVYYHTSDDATLKAAYDELLNGTGSAEQRSTAIDSLMDRFWVGPETFKGQERPKPRNQKPGRAEVEILENPDLILDPNQGRYLWLKLKLTTFDQKSRPSIRSARIFYTRLSYLRYLPPVYREDPVSAAFLERFLSMFETSFDSLEQEINQLFRYFDPKLTPKEFLPWLASWINLSLDDEVPEQRVRQFIRRAASLYRRKGTPGALVEFLELYTGKSVRLSEYLRELRPMVIGEKDSTLGRGVVLLGSGPRGITVGNTSVVGYSAVRDRVSDPDEPFLSLARRFAIGIDMDREELERRRPTLQRIVAEQAPAHTICTIRSISDQGMVGKAVLGITAKIKESRPYRVGLTQLGGGVSIGKPQRGLRLERGAWIGSSGQV
jgi:phage tail-like protein